MLILVETRQLRSASIICVTVPQAFTSAHRYLAAWMLGQCCALYRNREDIMKVLYQNMDTMKLKDQFSGQETKWKNFGFGCVWRYCSQYEAERGTDLFAWLLTTVLFRLRGLRYTQLCFQLLQHRVLFANAICCLCDNKCPFPFPAWNHNKGMCPIQQGIIYLCFCY